MTTYSADEKTTESEGALWRLVRARPTRCMVVFEEGLPYLARFYLAERADPAGTSTYAHYIFRSDADGWYHNHPWKNGTSLVVSGGYDEHVLSEDGSVASTPCPPGSLRTILPGTFHRVELTAGGAWTLFFATGELDEWGFRAPGRGYERWDVRNARLKPEKSIEIMSSLDPRLDRYLAESRPSGL